MLRIVLATTVQAHTFDVARELQRRQLLTLLFSGYPKARLGRRGLKGSEIRSVAPPVLAGMGLNRLIRNHAFSLRTEAWPKALFDAQVSRALPPCDVFVSTSSTGTRSGPKAQALGATWVCDRPCSHILNQDALLREEYEIQGKTWPGISNAIIDRELEEYEKADAILVPSGFAERSFIERGVSADKIWRIPYGVDLSRFAPGASPDPDRFDVLFAGQLAVRKGLSYLLDAFKAVKHPHKKLTLVGARQTDTEALLAQAGGDVEAVGAVPQARLAEYMSRSHVMVLPSIEEGLALVQAQALACGCPVVATPNTGGEDLFSEGVEGFFVPIRSSATIAQTLQRLVDEPSLRDEMSTRAQARARQIGGWARYVDALVSHCEEARS